MLGQLVVHEHSRGHEVAHHDQVGITHVCPRHGVFALEWVCVTADEHQGVVKQRRFNQVWVSFTIHGNAHFSLVVQHGLAHLVRGGIQ